MKKIIIFYCQSNGDCRVGLAEPRLGGFRRGGDGGKGGERTED